MQILSFFERAISNNYVVYFAIFIPIGLILYRQIRNAILATAEDDDDEDDDDDDDDDK